MSGSKNGRTAKDANIGHPKVPAKQDSLANGDRLIGPLSLILILCLFPMLVSAQTSPLSQSYVLEFDGNSVAIAPQSPLLNLRESIHNGDMDLFQWAAATI